MISLFTLRLPGNIFLILYFTFLPAVWLNWPGGAEAREAERGEAAGFAALLGSRRQVEELAVEGEGQAGGAAGPSGALHYKTKNSILFLFMRFNLRVLAQRLPRAARRSLPACCTDL